MRIGIFLAGLSACLLAVVSFATFEWMGGGLPAIEGGVVFSALAPVRAVVAEVRPRFWAAPVIDGFLEIFRGYLGPPRRFSPRTAGALAALAGATFLWRVIGPRGTL
jgi:hypothetical protein